MKKLDSIHSPGQLTVLAALLAGLCAPANAADSGAKVVISQVYGAGGNGTAGSANAATYQNDFIELFNRSGEDVSLAGMSVQYASTKGTSWGGRTNLNAVTLKPGQYYLVGEASQAAVGSNTPVPDQLGSVLMGAAAGKVALVSNTTALSGANPTGAQIIDFVGYGSGTDGFEGSGPTGALGNTLSASRIGNSCTDENNNAADFVVGAVAPRNRDTIAACGSVVTPPPTEQPIEPSCPALTVQRGVGGSGPLSATDQDSMVDNATITSGAVAGITLGAFSAAAADNQPGSVSLNVAATVATGAYPIGVTFTNNEHQSAACSVTVTVQAASAANPTIMDIQGAGATSDYANKVVTVDGVLTYKFPGTGTGFFIQDQNGDGNPATSDGIMIYGATTSAAVGDIVRVTGTVFEYKPAGQSVSYTEIKDTTAITRVGAGIPIQPTNIDMPMDLASVQGMLVRFTRPLVINSVASLGNRGELTLASVRRETPTNRYRAGSTEANQLAAANAIDQIVLDDGGFTAPNPIPFIGDERTVRVGDSIDNLVGVVDFGSIGNSDNAYKLQVASVAQVRTVRANPRPGVPTLAAGNVRVASANVLNFFTTFTNGTDVNGASGQGCTVGATTTAGNCRGADSMAEFVRQRDKIVNELVTLDADVVGLMEIQNKGNVAVDYLVDQMNAKVGFATYAAVPVPPATGTDAIRVAMIYKPAVVTLAGAVMSDGAAVNSRPPLAQAFKAANGAKFSVIVNHFKSKGSCPASGLDADQGDGQGCFNARRVSQASQLATIFLPEVKRVSGDDDVLVIGDLNSHGFEDPINALTAAGMVNELERFVRPGGMVYSYSFDGFNGYLDHALASPSLSAQVVGAAEWHNNADEPPVIDYNLDGKSQDLYVNNAYRASDHDPVIVSLNLAPTYADVSASFTVARTGYTVNRASGQYSGTLAITNRSGGAVGGPVQVELSGLPAGVTLLNKSGVHNGVPYITMSTAPLAAGATVTMPVQFSNPGKISFSYSTTIYSGTY